MDKESVLKAFYKSQIADLVETANDNQLLDMIYQLLKYEKEKGNKQC